MRISSPAGFRRLIAAGVDTSLNWDDMLLITEGQGPGWELDPKRSRPHKTHANTALLRSNAGPERTGPAQQPWTSRRPSAHAPQTRSSSSHP